MRKSLLLLVLLALGAAAPIAPAAAGDEEEVRILVEMHLILPFETIRKRVMAQVRGDYLGADWDGETRTYRFRFLVDGSVINVDVDAQTGQRIRKTKNY